MTPLPGSSACTRAPHPAIGGKGVRLAQSKTPLKRHRKVLNDNIRAITKGGIRRLARRGGVKRISAVVYDDARDCIKTFLKGVLHDCVAILDGTANKRRTVTVTDVIFALRRRGRPIYGFDKETYSEARHHGKTT